MVNIVCYWTFLILVAVSEAQDNEETTAVAISSGDLTEDKCNTSRAGCCSELYIGEEEDLVKCFVIHSPKLPVDGDADIGKTLRFLSCFVECLYKQKKYIGKSDTINMKMVKLDAEKTFVDRPKEKDYHIAMFEFCRKDAVGVYNLLKASPGAKVLLKGACRPYLLMVFMCISDYHQKHECPYFRWEGTAKAGTKDMCENAKAECYQIDGITLPTKSPA
uniref:RT06918p n=1 Tax=Drosophila melanogaster TaxID=7227 RepID=D4G7D7_DROME|nr:RT06918p [Drosophila melanogaster]